MAFRETVTVYCENHEKPMNTFCGQNAELLIVEAGSFHWALYSQLCVCIALTV